MKISNIIIISFVSFVLACTIALFISSAKHKPDKEKNDILIKMDELEAFTVLIAEEGTDIHINQSDSNFITFEYSDEKPLSSKLYSYSNDTLFVHSTNRAYVNCKNLKKVVTLNNFWLAVESIKTDKLCINTTGGENHIGRNNNSTNVDIKELNIISSDHSWVRIGNSSISSINLDLKNNSSIQMAGNCNLLIANLSTKSTLTLMQIPDRITLERESDCKLEVYR